MNSRDFKIALVRACATDWDVQDRLTGTLDVPLCDDGRSAAVDIARQLDFFSFATVIAAPGQAAMQTAEILAEELGLRLRKDPNLVNVDLGLWQGKQVVELESCQPTKLKNWQESPDRFAPPNGETTDHVRRQIHKSVRRWGRKYRGCQIIMVAPEPLASVIKSEFEHCQIDGLAKLKERCGRWEWLHSNGQVLA